MDYYGVESIGDNRAIPIIMEIATANKPLNVEDTIYRVKGIHIGDVTLLKIVHCCLHLYLKKAESTGLNLLMILFVI